MNKETDNEPRVVRTHDVHLDNDYVSWIADVKSRFRQAQIKAAVKVNSEQLLFNWQLGRDLVRRKAEEKWGTGIVEQVSLDLQAAFPKAKGFSARNLRNMRSWYKFYTQNDDPSIWHQLGAKLQSVVNQHSAKLHQLGAKIQDDKHLYQLGEEIIDNEKLHQLGAEFPMAVTKDVYDFGFLTLDHEDYDEEELEDALEKNITRFLLELRFHRSAERNHCRREDQTYRFALLSLPLACIYSMRVEGKTLRTRVRREAKLLCQRRRRVTENRRR